MLPSEKGNETNEIAETVEGDRSMRTGIGGNLPGNHKSCQKMLLVILQILLHVRLNSSDWAVVQRHGAEHNI